MLGRATALRVSFWAAQPVLLAAWLLMSPGRVLSREMTWDLLFNLEGAWHIQHGHVPHVDFHTPLGALTFWLTRVGFWMAGPGPQAVLIGQFLVLALLFVLAAVTASRRLPMIPAVLFVVYCALLVVIPVNVGDHPNVYSLAMLYNRWGWSALTTLCLLLFAEPAREGRGTWLDAAIGGLLLLFLFYLKVTLMVAALAALLFALLLSQHVRGHWRSWAAAIAVVAVNAAAPYNHAYLSDIWTATTSGYARLEPGDHLVSLLANKAEYAILGAGVLFLLWLWMRGWTRLSRPASGVVVFGLGLLVLSQNSQLGGIPVGIVIFFVIYQILRQHYVGELSLSGIDGLLMIGVLIWPLLGVMANLTMVAGYHRAATRDARLALIEATNLRGLAVPADAHDLANALERTTYRLSSVMRDPPIRDPLTQATYVGTLMEAAALFTSRPGGPVKILVLDQVNPMPFVLGYPPPRGSELWLWPQHPPRAADEIFGDVDAVLVPKYSTLARSTVFAVETYGDYLSRRFPVREETASWTVLKRTQSTSW